MKNEKAIDVLNSLITINNDRIEGYKTASDATDEYDLQSLFARFIETSQKCKQELVSEVRALGGKVAEGTKVSGKFFRAWMDVKAAITGKDRKAILSSCEFGEDQALETYAHAIANEVMDLSIHQQALIHTQKRALKADHDHVKALRDAYVEA